MVPAREWTTMADGEQSLREEGSADFAELLTRVVERDKAAFSQLYDQFSNVLLGVIVAVLKDRAEAEDVLQECFLSIWNKAESYRPHLGKPTSWMVTIAKNKAYDRYRKLVRTQEGVNVLRDHMEKPKLQETTWQPDEQLQVCLGTLNAGQRDSIELVFYQGLTQQEVSSELDAPLGTVKARIRRGLLKLKDCLKKGGRGDA